MTDDQLQKGRSRHHLQTRNLRLLLNLLLFGVVNVYAPFSLRAAGLHQVDRFKAFIENPPIIQRLVVEERVVRATANEFPYMLMKWQTNASFYRRFLDSIELTERTNERELAWASGRYEDMWWTVFGPSRQIQLWEDRGLPSEHTKTNPVMVAVNSGKYYIGQCMNFGIPELFPGTIRWNGNAFSETNTSTGHSVLGQLKTNDFNEVTGVNLETVLRLGPLGGNRSNRWELKYEYDKTSATPDLPKMVTIAGVSSDGTLKILNRLKYHELVVGGQLQGKDEFDPKEMAFANSQTFTYVSNRMTYLRWNGTIDTVRGLDDPILTTNIVQKRSFPF